jgi:hypothetical protein
MQPVFICDFIEKNCHASFEIIDTVSAKKIATTIKKCAKVLDFFSDLAEKM